MNKTVLSCLVLAAVFLWSGKNHLSSAAELAWNTYLGTTDNDYASSVAVDGSHNVYITGYSNASWGSPVRAFTAGSDDVFVAKLDSSGNVLWNTFLGGSGSDEGFSIAVDGSGNVYVTGCSGSTWGNPVNPFPSTTSALFAAKLDESGNLVWHTFLGGAGLNLGRSITVDGTGNVFVAGDAQNTWGTPVRAHDTYYDGVVLKLDSGGSLVWNTFLGGSDDDYCYALVLDGSANVYVTGYTYSTWGTPVRGFSDYGDSFAAKLNSNGSLAWNTFLGGSGDDQPNAIARDSSGNLYITGLSDTTWGAPLSEFASSYDAFIAKLDAGGGLAWNTFAGGTADDAGTGITLDGSGNIYISGTSYGTWGTPESPYGSTYNAFIAQYTSDGSLSWNTFVCGNAGGEGLGLALDGGSACIVGETSASWGTPVRAYSSAMDAYSARVALPAASSSPTPSHTPTATSTSTPVDTAIPTETPTATVTATATAMTHTPTATPSPTNAVSSVTTTPTPTATSTLSTGGTFTPTSTFTATVQATRTATATPTSTAADTPVITATLAATQSPDIDIQKDVMAYPNPAKDHAYFAWKEPNPQRAKVVIYNLVGETIGVVTKDHPGKRVEWQTSGIAAGIYIYQVILTVDDREKAMARGKVVIVK